jgi:hypothetical protein
MEKEKKDILFDTGKRGRLRIEPGKGKTEKG